MNQFRNQGSDVFRIPVENKIIVTNAYINDWFENHNLCLYATSTYYLWYDWYMILYYCYKTYEYNWTIVLQVLDINSNRYKI